MNLNSTLLNKKQKLPKIINCRRFPKLTSSVFVSMLPSDFVRGSTPENFVFYIFICILKFDFNLLKKKFKMAE
jgi:hypothetical protein